MTDLTMSQFASKDDLLAAQAARIAELEGSVTHLENVYGAAIRKVVELEQGKCLHQIAEPAAPVEKQIKDAIDALVMAAFTEGGCSEHRMSEARIQTELRKKELCTLIAATQPAAQGMEAQQYRLIERGELIEAGDQFLRDDFTWQIDPRGIFVGMPHGAALRPARRALAAQAKQGGA